MTHNLWTSERLIYRAIEEKDDDFFFANNADSASQMTAGPSPPMPKSRKDVHDFHQASMRHPLCVVICVPPGTPAPAPLPSTSSSDSDFGTHRAAVLEKAALANYGPDEPIPIGNLMIRYCGGGTSLTRDRTGEIGIRLNRQYQGRGYGAEALEWALEMGFRHLNLHKIALRGLSNNLNGLRLYRKLGFTQEGCLRQDAWRDGGWVDIIIFGILDHEWPDIKKGLRRKREEGSEAVKAV